MTHASANIRRATLDDLNILVAHRRAMFEAMGWADQAALDAMAAAFRPWLRRKMEENEYLAWLALDDRRQVAAGLGLWLMDWPPHMIGPGARRGNILNVYTRPENRRQGLARSLMQTALGWCGEHGVRAVILHASQDGRELYRRLGFQPTNEMRLELKEQGGRL